MTRKPNLEAREKILKAAFELFYERGFKGVSMDDVASAAGLKKANLFHYYPTKEALGLAVLEHGAKCETDKFTARLTEGTDPIKAVEAIFKESADAMDKSNCRGGCLLGNLAQELSDTHEALRKKICGHLTVWVEGLTACLQKGKQSGFFKAELKPREAAEAVVSMLEGSTLMAKAQKESGPLDTGRRMAAGYLKGYKK